MIFGMEKRFRPREVPRPPEAEIGKVKELMATEDYETTPEANAAREYVKKIQPGPHREAIETFAYYFLPKFFNEHPKIERKPDPEEVKRDERPRALSVNVEFRQAVESFTRGFGVHLKDEEINVAWDLANEYLDNVNKPEEEGGEQAA